MKVQRSTFFTVNLKSNLHHFHSSQVNTIRQSSGFLSTSPICNCNFILLECIPFRELLYQSSIPCRGYSIGSGGYRVPQLQFIKSVFLPLKESANSPSWTTLVHVSEMKSLKKDRLFTFWETIFCILLSTVTKLESLMLCYRFFRIIKSLTWWERICYPFSVGSFEKNA